MSTITLDAFVAKWTGKPVDFDHAFGPQCVDLIQQYLKDVHNLPPLIGNAVDLFQTAPSRTYERVRNLPENTAPKGAIIVWGEDSRIGTGPFGHTGVCLSGTVGTLLSFDLNWAGKKFCTPVVHDYRGCIGWLSPRHAQPHPPPPPAPHAGPPKTARDAVDTLNRHADYLLLPGHLTPQALNALLDKVRTWPRYTT